MKRLRTLALLVCTLVVPLCFGATAGNGVALTTSPTTVFDATAGGDLGPCKTIYVVNRSTSAGNVLVNVTGLHAAADFAGVAPGVGPVYFAAQGSPNAQITKVVLKSDSTATVDWGVSVR